MARIAVVEKDKCHPNECGNYLCIRLCPVNRTGDECIVEGPDKKALIYEELCTGCGICPNRCPFGAIHIINLPKELDKDPIHKYGIDDFRLYNLPIPVPNKVVGVLGRNGIGKSTAIKILAGVIKPNLGNLDKEPNYDDVIKFFKGTEAQSVFEKIRDGKLKVAYKPQNVEMIPKATSGKVVELLKKVDEKDMFEKVVDKLSLREILNNDISKISGGELQRVAVAATYLKNANLYIFDEPSSFLDIKQRLIVSNFIRELAANDNSVLVIEHDLIVLDYVADLLHIMYGDAGAYGVVSGVKSAKDGINVYLSGFLKEENVRFRDKKISFETRPVFKNMEMPSVVNWSGFKKKFGNFNLVSKAGEIKSQDVIGILGENGIGKTSFVKILAGKEIPDEGEIPSNLHVAYKAQDISTDSEELVMNYLQEAMIKFKSQIVEPLGVEPLFLKRMNTLSGGELQRVVIAKTLSEMADVYLFDEPSAHLDVEQRLLISKVIRDIMDFRGSVAMIVDHDLLFLDYLSKKLVVFNGKPAVSGYVEGPFNMKEGMTKFLSDLNLTFRRDPESHRPRANKVGSVKDREQKSSGNYYYL